MKRITFLIAFLCVISFSIKALGTTTKLDDADPGWTWYGFTAELRAESYAGTQHYSNNVGDSAKFNFTGTQIKFYAQTWNGGGSIEIFIDGVSKGVFSESLPPYAYQTAFATITGLVDTNHTVKLVSTTLNWPSIDYVEYTSSVAQVTTAILDDADTGWTWYGFIAELRAASYAGTQHYSNNVGDSAKFNFTGTQIKFYAQTWDGAGSIEIFIDGVSKGVFSESIPPYAYQTAFATITGLVDTNHTVKLVSTTLNWPSIDYVEYTSASIVIVPDPNVTVSAENPSSGEVASKLVDSDLSTKWSAPSSTAWIQIAYKAPKIWNKYSLTSGNDDATRDLKNWTLKGSNDGTNWDVLDTKTGVTFPTRNGTVDFPFANIKAYSLYKFDVTANNGNANSIQLSEIAFSYYDSGALEFSTTGSCASYITWNNQHSHQADSAYNIVKTNKAIVVDGLAEGAWNDANTAVIKKVTHDQKMIGEVVDLSVYPQSETDLYATYRAMWTDNGVYMFIDVKDDKVRYQNTDSQWENDAIEFYFAKAVGEGKLQIIIPAMVGLTNPSKPAAKTFESGSAVGSDPSYKIFGYDATNWDETLFNWAIRKTDVGYNIEVYMDKDIVTNGNSATNYGVGKSFAGDINVDEADDKVNGATPPLFNRESTLAMLGSSKLEYTSSNDYGLFNLVDGPNAVNSPSISTFNAIYNSANKTIDIKSNSLVKVIVYNVAGQVMPVKSQNTTIFVNNLNPGLYFVKAKDVSGNNAGTQKVVIY